MTTSYETEGIPPESGQAGPDPAQTPPPPTWQPVSAGRDPRRKSVALATCLSLLPGLGQIYVGYYQRGFVHIIVVAALITLLSAPGGGGLEPLLGLFLVFFWIYNMIDAARRATAFNHALEGIAPGVTPPQDFQMPGEGGSMVLGGILVVVGALALANTVLGLSLDWLEEWWPLALIGFGAYLLRKGREEKASKL